MAHAPDVHERAFSLWCEGIAIDDICKLLEIERKHVNRKTIMTWKKREGWAARKAAVLARAAAKTDAALVEDLKVLRTEVSKLRARVFEDLQDCPAPRSLVGGVQAYTMLLDRAIKLMPPQAVEGDAGEVVKKILDVLFKHPKVGVVIEKYRDELMAELNKVLDAGKARP